MKLEQKTHQLSISVKDDFFYKMPCEMQHATTNDSYVR